MYVHVYICVSVFVCVYVSISVCMCMHLCICMRPQLVTTAKGDISLFTLYLSLMRDYELIYFTFHYKSVSSL